MYLLCIFLGLFFAVVADRSVQLEVGVTVQDDQTTTKMKEDDRPLLFTIQGTVLDDVTTDEPTETNDVTTQSRPDDIECDRITHSGCNVTNFERCYSDVSTEPRCECLVGFARSSDGRACIGQLCLYIMCLNIILFLIISFSCSGRPVLALPSHQQHLFVCLLRRQQLQVSSRGAPSSHRGEKNLFPK